jgi:cytochrome c oxidase subunit IV
MKAASAGTYLRTWAVLIALLALTCASAFVPMGRLNTAINVSIAALKALIVVFVFMHLKKARPMVWLTAVAGVAWLSLLVGMSLADYLIRSR